MAIKKIMVILNPQAGLGRAQECLQKIEKWRDRIIKEKGIEAVIELTEKFGERNATNLAKKAVEEGYDQIIAVGGDGTVNEVANGVVGSDISVGLVPIGNGNDFVKVLGIPKNIEEALRVAIEGKITLVDLGKINERYFVNFFGVGLVAKVIQSAESFKQQHRLLTKIPLIKSLLNSFIYLFAVLRVLGSKLEYPHLEVKISRGRNPLARMTGRVILLLVANAPRCARIFRLAPQADLRDGLLDICWIKKISRWRIFRFMGRGIKGTHLSLPEVRTFSDERLPRASSLTIFSLENQNLLCQTDGEILSAEKEYRITILPKAFKVIVPNK